MVAVSESELARFTIGERNLITDVNGLIVGNAHDQNAKTGTTVLTSEQPFTAAVDVMGGAPGTRETDCLGTEKLVERVDALVLSGGSAFGLEAASGVANQLGGQGRGFPVGNVNIPIVPAAILFDFLNGGEVSVNGDLYRTLGASALNAASPDFNLGSVGAGYGATSADYKGGLGSASLILPDGSTVGALVAANPHGSAVVPGTGHFWAAPFEVGNEFGGLGVAAPSTPLAIPQNRKVKAYEELARRRGGSTSHTSDVLNPDAPMNTTIAIVATDVKLSKPQLKRLAVAAQDGLARALVPAHTVYDGDLIFSLSTGERELRDPVADSMLLGHAVAICLTRAIARAIYEASADKSDTLPTWRSEFGSAS